MIPRKRAGHHRRNRELAVLDDRPLFAEPDRQDAALRRIDDRRELADAVHAEIGDREGAALKLLELQFAGAGALGKVLALARDLREALLIGTLDDRRDEPVIERYRDGDIDPLPEEDRLVAP